MAADNQNRTRSSPTVMILAGIILLAGTGLVIWALQLAQEPGAEPQINNPVISRVNMADAINAWEQETAIFVDVRDQDVYASAHIPGAISIPLDSIQQQLNTLDPGAWIIPYCT
jgi:hypothetical protein